MALLSAIALLLSSGIVASTFLSLGFFYRLDFLVSNDLYQYGLWFSQDWATTYADLLWSSKSIVLVAATLSGVVTLLLLLSVLRPASDTEDTRVGGVPKALTVLLLSLASGLVAASMIFVSRLDFLVHNDLYQYGLWFSLDWATPYWQNLAILQALLMTAVGLGVSILVIVLRSRVSVGTVGGSVSPLVTGVRSRLPDEGLHLSLEHTWLAPLSVGVAAIGVAAFLNLSVLAIVGVGSAFCGFILRFLTDEQYARKSLLDAAVAAQIASVEKLIEASRQQDRVAVYLPPKFLATWRENKVYLTSQPETLLMPDVSNTMSPPGDELVKVLEHRLQKTFVEVDLPFLEKRLPSLLSELEIAESVEMTVDGNHIVVEMRNCIYGDGLKGIPTSSKATQSLGSPVTSAIACALTKAVAQPVVINKETLDADILHAEYTFLGGNAQ
jgi:hypothetical protein